jgi:hypothetical protein
MTQRDPGEFSGIAGKTPTTGKLVSSRKAAAPKMIPELCVSRCADGTRVIAVPARSERDFDES